MVRTTISITIDSELIEKFREKEGKGNVSKAITQFIEHSLNLQNGVISAPDKELLNIELEQTKKQFNEVSIKLRSLEQQKENIVNELEQQKKSELLAQKELEENAIKCIKCKGITFENRRKKMTNGFMCRACFETLTVEDYRIYT